MAQADQADAGGPAASAQFGNRGVDVPAALGEAQLRGLAVRVADGVVVEAHHVQASLCETGRELAQRAVRTRVLGTDRRADQDGAAVALRRRHVVAAIQGAGAAVEQHGVDALALVDHGAGRGRRCRQPGAVQRGQLSHGLLEQLARVHRDAAALLHAVDDLHHE